MKLFNMWSSYPFGKKLKKLHSWNAWLVILLAVSGIILFLPALRGETAFMRVQLKDLHIILGLISIIIILLYIPLFKKHKKQIRGKLNQQFNLGVVLFFLIGWSVSGIVLWQYRSLPDIWSQIALFIHDLLTWIGIPWVIYHSVTRIRWVRNNEAIKDLTVNQEENPPKKEVHQANQLIQWLKKSPLSRRQFVRWSVGLIFILSIGPAFYRWIKRVTDTGGSALETISKSDGNNMLPSPKPLPKSKPPVGGGLKGDFRVYTVTDIPSSSSESWEFGIGGLVKKPVAYSWQEFLSLPRKVQVSDFHCVTGWSVYHVTWEGIPLKQLLEEVGVQPEAKYVKFYSGDRVYTDSLTIKQTQLEDVMIAVLMDGQPIPQKLGGPVRLIVPQMYAYKSVKWLQAIELINDEHIGYWEARGYDTDAWIR